MKTLFLVVCGLILLVKRGHFECREVHIDFCKDVGYNMTIKPAWHAQDPSSGYNLEELRQIVETKCSPDIAIFLCSVVSPECEESRRKIDPCRNLCRRVKKDCAAVLQGKGLSWPHNLDCDSYRRFLCNNGQQPVPTRRPPGSCVEIRDSLPSCEGLYRFTIVPNILKHSTFEQAGKEMQKFQPLLDSRCSPYLHMFLCTMFAPPCVFGMTLPPCRSLCEYAKRGCQEAATKLGLNWPSEMDCEDYEGDDCGLLRIAHNKGSVEKWAESSVKGQCQRITEPLCQRFSYKHTIMPNTLGHRSQQEAANQMSILLQSRCSVEIQFFMCLLFFPRCVDGLAHLPCRSLCERTRAECQGGLYSSQWPDFIHCGDLPEDSCIREDDSQELPAEEALRRLNEYDHKTYTSKSMVITKQSYHSLLALKDSDESGAFSVKEVENATDYLANIRTMYEKAVNMGQLTKTHMKATSVLKEYGLEDKSFDRYWNRYGFDTSKQFDDYVVFLVRLLALKEQFNNQFSNLTSECKESMSFSKFLHASTV